MNQTYEGLVRKMREVIADCPDRGIELILRAERQVILEDAEATAIWAEKQEGRELRQARGRGQ